jgi:hypothetical protein
MTRGNGADVSAARSDAATATALHSLVAASGAPAVAVIGLVKNAGKTTVVNALLAQAERCFGLTSLGLDGERTDHLTGLAKPSIAPPAGTVVATTEGSLARSRYDLDVLETLPFHTPLGHVVIGLASGDGCVEVSGPTTLAELRATIERVAAHGAHQVLVDGAINRLGSASPRVSEGLVMATGGMVGDTLDEVVETTRATLDMLTIPQVSDETRSRLEPHLGSARVVAFDADGEAAPLEIGSVIGEGVAVAREVARRKAATLYVGGALTDEFVDDFTRVLPPRHRLRVVVRDATVLVLPAASVARFARRGIALEALRSLCVLAVTVNPFRVPQPYRPRLFFAAIAEALGGRVPVFDVVNGLSSPADAGAATTAGERVVQ